MDGCYCGWWPLQRESSNSSDQGMSVRKLSEVARLCVLAFAGCWLLHPFATARSYGGGDAVWYAHMLADYVFQLRAGVFPVFAGQTDFAFNGAVYPLRVAPLYQHLAAVLDLVTLHSLGVFALQHLTVIVCGAAGIFGSYWTLCWIAPSRRWSAACFAILYLSCPGVLATIYTQDLYMTWMTVGLAPFAAYAIVRTFRSDGAKSQVILGASLASLWWAHSPIALWFTIVAVFSQVARLMQARPTVGALKRSVLGASVFVLLAQYPFVSVAMIGSPGEHSPASVPLAHPELIAENIRQSYPAALLPIHNAEGLGGLQLGYGLWAVLLASALVIPACRKRELTVLVTASFVLILLLLPIPGLNRLLWSSMPGAILRITYYWPMQRFYLIIAALTATAGQIAWDSCAPQAARFRLPVALLIAACCTWSLQQVGPFIRAAKAATSTPSDSTRSMRPENRLLMDHAYGLFPGLPPHFSNGVVDPRSEARLIPEPSDIPVGNLVSSGLLVGTVDANPGILDLDPRFRLAPGQRYQLDIGFGHPAVSGILQCVGHTFFREYLLPSSGGPQSFGSGPTNSHRIDVWSSDPAGDDISLRFIPAQPGPSARSLAAFGSFQLRERMPEDGPVEVISLLPFQARVRTPSSTILETPRMYMPGYDASVDGNPVAAVKTPSRLVGVPLSAGEHMVVLRYPGPILLRISYWAALVSWAAAFCVLAANIRPLRS
jgi:hypothetical protein